MISPGGNRNPLQAASFTLFILSAEHLVIPNSIPMSQILLFCFLHFSNNFTSSLCRRWFNDGPFFPHQSSILTFFSVITKSISDITNSNGENKSPCKIPLLISTSPMNTLLEVQFGFPLFQAMHQKICDTVSSTKHLQALTDSRIIHHIIGAGVAAW